MAPKKVQKKQPGELTVSIIETLKILKFATNSSFSFHNSLA